MGALRLNLEAPFLLSVPSRAAIVLFLIHRHVVVPVRYFRNNFDQIAVNRPFYGERGFTLCFGSGVSVNLGLRSLHANPR